ncbi:MAG: nucleoside kinase [Clostridiales bacterium]|nr:nucleoside kinase [Clostridiales bacterium]
MTLFEEAIKVKVGNEIKTYPRGISLEELSREYADKYTTQIVAAKVDKKMCELTKTLDNDCEVEFIDRSTKDGERIYLRSLTFIFIRACRELFPHCRVLIEHSMNKGLYCEVHGDFTLSPRQVSRIEQRMREIVERNEPFQRFTVDKEEAKRIFQDMGFNDKIKILEYRPEQTVNLYRCGWMTDYLFGYMVPSTGYITMFELQFYLPGVIIRYPRKGSPNALPEPVDNPNLSRIFREAEKWGAQLGVENVADLNDVIRHGDIGDLIRVCEAQHEKQIAQIADEIAAQRDRIHLIIIAGPSSSGKTTFAQRLRIQLMVNGMRPIPISIDNYFLHKEDIPLDEDGERDIESIKAIDIELFNEHLTRIIQGQEVEIPYFNFEKGQREYRGHKIRIDDNQPIIIEGIHGLNEELTVMIPKRNKYKIYISALTQLNIDDHNRIPTTDGRLIRRIVRDYQFRGASIEDTLSMWPSVRRGEEQYIFPYQEQADIMFNSALVYELAVLKPYIERLLDTVSIDSPYYMEVNRLQKFMKYFLELDATEIPKTSIIREFIGGSCFKV